MLLETTLKYRVDTEIQAKDTIDAYREQAKEKGFIIKKASYERKDKKSKGEIIATVFVVTITQVFAALWEDIDG